MGGWVLWYAMSALGQTGPKIVSVLSLVIGGIALYGVLVRYFKFSGSVAFMMAVVTVLTPAAQTALSASMVQFFLGFGFFYLGLLAYLASDRCHSIRRFVLYSLGVLAAAIAVSIAEAPVGMTPIYPLALVFCRHIDKNYCSVWDLGRDLICHSLVVVVGLVVLGGTALIFPAFGGYSHSQHLITSIPELYGSIKSFMNATILIYRPLMIVVAMTMAVALWRLFRGQGAGVEKNQHAIALILFGAIAFAGGAALYIVAGRIPGEDWTTRYLVFTGLGLSLLLTAVVNHCGIAAQLPGRAATFACVIAAALCVNQWVGLLHWSGRQMKDDAMLAAFVSNQDLGKVGALWVEDRVITIGEPRYYEWTAMLQAARGGNQTVVVNGTGQETAHLQEATENMISLFLIKAPQSTCQARMEVGPAQKPTILDGAEGLVRRYATSRESYMTWLGQRIKTEVTMLPGCTA